MQEDTPHLRYGSKEEKEILECVIGLIFQYAFECAKDKRIEWGMFRLKKLTVCAFAIIALVTGGVVFSLINSHSPESAPSTSPAPKGPFFPYNNVTVEPGKSLLDLVPIRSSGYSGVIMEMQLQSIDTLELLQNTLMFQQNSWILTDTASYWIQTVLVYRIAADDRAIATCIVNLWERGSTARSLINGVNVGAFYLPDTPYNVTMLTYIGVDGYPHSVVKVNNGLLLNYTETAAGSFSLSVMFSSMNQFLITSSYDTGNCPDVSGYFTVNKYLDSVWSAPSLSLLEKQDSQAGEFSEVLTFAITGSRVEFFPASKVPSAHTGIAYT